jgi:pimeloyl-ACP methyl ester carboxylesterase
VLRVRGAGHWPHREDEDVFLEELLGFLKSL